MKIISLILEIMSMLFVPIPLLLALLLAVAPVGPSLEQPGVKSYTMSICLLIFVILSFIPNFIISKNLPLSVIYLIYTFFIPATALYFFFLAEPGDHNHVRLIITLLFFCAPVSLSLHLFNKRSAKIDSEIWLEKVLP